MNATARKWFFIVVVLFVAVLAGRNVGEYVPPTPLVQPFTPKGFRISIPHEDGITLVAFHIKINEDFDGLEAGTFARDITKIRDGRWVFEDKGTRLAEGDVIFYWIHVVYKGLGYNLLDQQHVVTEFFNRDGTSANKLNLNGTKCDLPSETKIIEIVTASGYDQPLLKRKDVCPESLIFEENFDTLDTNRWQIVSRFPGNLTYEFVVYQNNGERVVAKNGALHITPILSNTLYDSPDMEFSVPNCTSHKHITDCHRKNVGPFMYPPVISGRLNSKLIFQYGRVQVRAKLPRGDWIYPIITLETIEKEFRDPTLFCDIVVALSFGNPALRTQNGYEIGGLNLIGGAHLINATDKSLYSNLYDLPRKLAGSLWSADYHVYDLEWTRGRVTLKVDGEQYGKQNIPDVCDTPMFLSVGLAVGGVILFPDRSVSGEYVKPWKNVGAKVLLEFKQAKDKWLPSWNYDNGLHVDYIKIWGNPAARNYP